MKYRHLVLERLSIKKADESIIFSAFIPIVRCNRHKACIQCEELLRDLLFTKGGNIRLCLDMEEAILWAQAYP
ncbi:MAG: hypothetical protein OQK50_05235 [Deltaproteobacteria bacterium]|nr:hypothetical protein [Deltaproteobacteria bacterium]